MRYLLKALLVVCLLAPIHPMLAQDEGKPVPVEKAAYHWPIFSNDYIMMLRVYMRPGKGSNFHIHSLDQISILVEAGANEGQVFGKAEKIPAKAGTRGSVGFTAFSKKTFTHRSTNTAETRSTISSSRCSSRVPAASRRRRAMFRATGSCSTTSGCAAGGSSSRRARPPGRSRRPRRGCASSSTATSLWKSSRARWTARWRCGPAISTGRSPARRARSATAGRSAINLVEFELK